MNKINVNIEGLDEIVLSPLKKLLLEKVEELRKEIVVDKIYTPEKAQKEFNIGESTLRSWRKDGLKHFVIDRKVYFLYSDIKDYITDKRHTKNG